MAKDLPYFKFFCSEWNDGDITLESFEIQGIFINICSYYWSKECEVTKKLLYKRFRNEKESIDYIIDEDLMKFNGEHLSIKFLDEQFSEIEASSKVKSAAGKKSAELKKLRKEINKLCKDFSVEFNTDLTELQQEFNTDSTDVDFLLQHISTIKIRRDNIRKNKEEIRGDEVKKINIDSMFNLDFLIDYYLSDKDLVKVIIENKEHKLKDIDHLKNRLESFKLVLIEQGRKTETFREFAKYFRNWLKSVKDEAVNSRIVHNPNNEKIIIFNTNVNPTRQKLPESDFIKYKENMEQGGYKFNILN